jgi:hypothetical protein
MANQPNPELDAHLATRLPQLVADVRTRRAEGNRGAEEAISETINVALDRMADRNGWQRG